MARDRTGGIQVKERGGRTRGRQDYREQTGRPFQPRDWTAPAGRRPRNRRRNRPPGWGNAAVAAAAALAGVLVGAATARRGR
ncbi:hypothetical protein HC028_04735 [Planosporangium flavigriseum]|uniref:Uncharacterized protein n=1 Tax=Planosporangium flavigriseum TaxID=373681 RepID=A0A8J3LKV8_9ACTN|nr:hypothetical protein [Planosporangium flavigriseum]NJC63815.1 hypothetical protein [Planosporangium flavigriseum]GIG73687.1 hypothetical protein Pfl04_20910 [Planosporangium flavigriseum]